MLGDSPVKLCEWLVVIDEFFVVDDPSPDVVPYITCAVAVVLVVHDIVAEFVVIFDAATFEIVMLLPPLPPVAAVSRSVCASMFQSLISANTPADGKYWKRPKVPFEVCESPVCAESGGELVL